MLATAALQLAQPTFLPSLDRLGLPTAGMRRRASYKTTAKAYHLAGWDMRIEHDGFTGQVRCRLFAAAGWGQGRMGYAQGVVGFHLGAGKDVAGAWYRIDDKAVRPWRDDYSDLIARRAPLDSGSLTNPTGGVVFVPAERLAGAGTVTIRASRHSRPKRFQLKGFEQALTAARANGCSDTASFVMEPW